jgi:hypothetical protein
MSAISEAVSCGMGSARARPGLPRQRQSAGADPRRAQCAALIRYSHDALCGADRARTTEYTSRTATHQQNQQALEAILAGLGLSITLPQVQRATRGHGWCQLPMALLIDLVEMVSGLSAFAPGNLTRAVASASTRAPRRLAPSRMPAPLALLPLADPLSSGLPAT